MKKFIILFTIVLLTGCSTSISSIDNIEKNNNNDVIRIAKTESNEEIEEKQTDAFDSDKIVSQLEVNEYNLFGTYFNYHFIEVINNSDFIIDIDANILYYDADNNLISAESASEELIEPGYSALLYTMPDEKWSSTDISIEATEPWDYYLPVQSDISVDVTPAKSKLVVQAKNTSDKAVEFVQIHALFFKGDKVVGHDWKYFTDSDSEIKPGKTISENLDIYSSDFDGYKYYVTGRRHK